MCQREESAESGIHVEKGCLWWLLRAGEKKAVGDTQGCSELMRGQLMEHMTNIEAEDLQKVRWVPSPHTPGGMPTSCHLTLGPNGGGRRLKWQRGDKWWWEET